MPEALILEFTGVSEVEYAAVNKHIGIDMHGDRERHPQVVRQLVDVARLQAGEGGRERDQRAHQTQRRARAHQQHVLIADMAEQGLAGEIA